MIGILQRYMGMEFWVGRVGFRPGLYGVQGMCSYLIGLYRGI